MRLTGGYRCSDAGSSTPFKRSVLARNQHRRRWVGLFEVVGDDPTGPLMVRADELRARVTAYDACYVALAEALGCVLVTVAWAGHNPGVGHVDVRPLALVGVLVDLSKMEGEHDAGEQSQELPVDRSRSPASSRLRR